MNLPSSLAFPNPGQFRPALASEVREVDRRAIEEFGLPGIALMENAGRAAAEVALRKIRHLGEAAPAVILCGKGNNGGDGFVIARHLHNQGQEVQLFLTHPPETIQGDARTNSDVFLKMANATARVLEEEKSWHALEDVLTAGGLIIDALLGTGLSRNIRPPLDKIVRAINAGPGLVLAVDTPSGLHSDTGAILGCCVKADATVTFALPKKGFYLGKGPEMAGDVILADIGLPAELLESFVKSRNLS